MMNQISKYVMASFGLILVYLILTKSKEFNSTISAFGNVALKGAGLLQGRTKDQIVGV